MARKIRVAVIGAGFGGVCMAAELLRSGLGEPVLFERKDDIGGIWRDNVYPGCSCDVPSHLYSYSFEQYRSAVHRFPGQEAILQYLRGVTQKYDLHRRTHLRTGIDSAHYDDDTGEWHLYTTQGEKHTVDVVVSAVGQLHYPRLPEIPGRDDFHGTAMHTAQWDPSCDLDGARVAVIGTGSSAAQLIPHLARRAQRVYVHQRTPHWVLPKPRDRFGALTRAAFTLMPSLQSAYRSLTQKMGDSILFPAMKRGWSARPLEWFARQYLRRSVQDPKLRAELTPQYPIGCKRILVDSGFYPALGRENVELVADRIEKITSSGIVTRDGTHRDLDAIVYATGFRTTEFLVPMHVQGRRGADLHKRWDEGAEAYLGVALPEFPNFFMVHGPNTFISTNSNIAMKEYQVRHVLNCLRMLTKQGHGQVEVRADAMQQYRVWLEKKLATTVWCSCHNWYQTHTGRLVNPWPSTTRKYKRMVLRNPEEAFEVHDAYPTAKDRTPSSPADAP